MDLNSIQLLRERLVKNEVIAKIIGCFPAVTPHDGQLEHCIIVTRQGYKQKYQFDINLWVLNTFLHGEWLRSSAVDGAILSHLPTASYGTQYVSVTATEEMIRQLRRDAPASKALVLNPSTDRLVILINVCDTHWCVAMAKCVSHYRVVTVYNSSPHIGVSQLERQLPQIINYIIDANSLPLWTNSLWSMPKVQFASVAVQDDSYNCGVYTILNSIALLSRQDPPRQVDNINQLPTDYAKGFMAGLYLALGSG